MTQGYDGLPPYYGESSEPITPNLLLNLWGMDPIVAEDFVKIDTAFGSVSGSVKVNGVAVPSPNFINSASVTFGVVGSNISLTATGGGGGSGTVTSVGLTMPGIFSVSGSPITTAGTLAVSLASEAQNSVFAGPTSGAGTPTFRALVAGDIPALPYLSNSTVLPATKAAVTHQWLNSYTSTTGLFTSTQPAFTDISGSIAIGQTPLTTAGDMLYANATPALARLGIGTTGQVLTVVGGLPAWAAASGGVVTSVFGRTGAVTAETNDYASVPGGLSLGDDGGDAIIMQTSGLGEGITIATNTLINLLGSGGAVVSINGNVSDGFYIRDDTGDNSLQGGDSVIGITLSSTEQVTINTSVFVDASGNLNLLAELVDSLSSPGTSGQLLSSTGTAVVWTSGLPAISAYNGNTTTKAGIPSILATSILTGKTSAISHQSLVASTPAIGMWQISFVATQTTAGSTGTVLGGVTGFTVTYTNANGDTVSKTTAISAPATAVGTSTSDSLSGVFCAYAGSGTAINYSFGYTAGGVTGGAYDMAVYAQFLG